MPQAKRRVTLFHNRSAGEGDHDEQELTHLIAAAGYEVAYFDAKRYDIPRVLDRPTDLVVVAGGDGTIRRVALAARPEGPPLAILPLGTANNIAHSLGITASTHALIDGWRHQTIGRFYPIEAETPWGRQRLIEGIGLGVLADLIEDDQDKDSTPLDARRRAAELVDAAEPESFELRVDDALVTEPAILLEVTTIPLVGPNLLLAPGANPGDQFIEVCRVPATGRRAFAQWLEAPKKDAPAPLSLTTAGYVAISGRFDRIRVDDAVRTVNRRNTVTIALAAAAQPLHVVLPEQASG
ncbi:MAG TPA: diacylglycerol kinase family protein [Stellaceae bacterium]|nr:diacylglycerol kinase family protein [Stellaceae bacterium]